MEIDRKIMQKAFEQVLLVVEERDEIRGSFCNKYTLVEMVSEITQKSKRIENLLIIGTCLKDIIPEDKEELFENICDICAYGLTIMGRI